MGREKRAVELSKRIVAYTANIAIQKHMAELEERQDILGSLADMMIDVYLMDSIVARVSQDVPSFGREKTSIQREMTTLLVADAYDRVVQNAGRLAASIAEEDELQVIFSNLERLHVVRPVNQFRAIERIAVAVIEAGGSPLLS